jgi:hypothetical protein
MPRAPLNAGNAAVAQLDLLLALIDQSFDAKAWHGPNLRNSIRGVNAAQAAWRPQPARHSIAEQVLHAAYWKYVARRRLRGDKRGSFPLKGTNWWPVGAADFNERRWQETIAILEAEHSTLREAVAAFDPNALNIVPLKSRVTYAALIYGVASHDVYHAGQIQLLKAMRQ